MSHLDFGPEMYAALDRFDAPGLSNGFVDRVMAVAAPASRPAARDRRGAWKLARRVVVGTLAAGMVSAAAVASGLLGAAGIKVPVLTAMLAPAPVQTPVVKTHKPVVRMAMLVKPHAAPEIKRDNPGLVDPGNIAPPVMMRPSLGGMMARRTERRMARRAMLAANPQLRPVIRQAMRDERAFVRDNPDVRALRHMPRFERRAFLAERPELKAAVRAHWAERRALMRANPEVAGIMRMRRAQRRGAMAPEPVELANPDDLTKR